MSLPASGRGGEQPSPSPVLDPRRYRWMIGAFGLVLVLVFSVHQLELGSHGVSTPGVLPGQPLRDFAAPLASSTLNGDANLHPSCTLARHDPRALNLCLLLGHGPLVLGLFVTNSRDCRRQIDTLQAVSREFPAGRVQFAAVAVRGDHAQTAALARAHHWTIPVAYDLDGAVGGLYGVEICPMVELATRGGIVTDRLIGDHWLARSALAARIRALLIR
ncbi:MAG: TlpA family protein disulfide reductase [Solirubrobacteraceae bacterium]